MFTLPAFSISSLFMCVSTSVCEIVNHAIVLAALASLTFSARVSAQQTDTLLHSIPPPSVGAQTGARLGYSVAVDGAYAIVGAPLDDTAGRNSGVAKVFDATSGNLLFVLVNPNPGSYANFGNSVAISGTQVVVGASADDTGATNAGRAYVFDLGGGAPTVPIAVLNNPNPTNESYFGLSVAISGSRVAIGTPQDDTGVIDAGRVYIYDLNSGTPTVPLGSLNNPNAEPYDRFGTSVAISGTNLVVGTPQDDMVATDAGSAYVYDLSNGMPTAPMATLNNPSPAVADYFGTAVAISGTLLVVGASSDDTRASNAGSAYVYDLSNGIPIAHAITINNPGPAAGEGFGTSVAISNTRLVVGTPYDITGAEHAGSAYVYNIASGTPTLPVATLNNPGPASGDYFGYSVAISGTRVLVGAYYDDTGATDAGSAYVYDISSATPTAPVSTLNNPGPASDSFFGSSVAASGTRIVIGSLAESAYVYDLGNGNPMAPAMILNNPTTGNDGYGSAVAISGTRVVVGAHGNATGATGAGIAYVYDMGSGTPTVPVATLNNPSPEAYDGFGFSVAISGTKVVVGARSDNTGAVDAGSVYVYDLERPTPTVILATLNNPSPANGDGFGFSVAISGNRVVVGARTDDAGAVNAGSTYVYDLGSGTPTLPMATLSNPAPAGHDQFGHSVAISGTRVVVGALYDDTGAINSGSAYIYDLASGNPAIPIATLNAPSAAAENYFGQSVAISGSRVVVGAHHDDTGASDAGATFVYDLGSETPTTPVAVLSNPEPGSNDHFGSSVAIDGAVVVVGTPDDSSRVAGTGFSYVFGPLQSPEMGITGNGAPIFSGDTIPTRSNHTGFGSISVGSGSVTRTFTISNAGSAPLNLTGNPFVSLGTNEAFLVTSDPATTINPGGSTTFTITFDPHIAGPNEGLITIVNNDPEDSHYTFTISGYGLSDDATLTGISLSGGAISPVFYSDRTSYSLSLPNATETFAVTPIASHSEASLEIRIHGGAWIQIESGEPTPPFTLSVGTNVIDIQITAEDGGHKIYTLAVTRDKAIQTIAFNQPGPQLANAPFILAATGGGSGNAVTFTVEGPCQIVEGDVLVFTGTGLVTVRANQAGNDLYHAASEVAHTFSVSAASASVSISDTIQVYTGSPGSVSVTTTPPNLAHSITYSGEVEIPVDAGTYQVDVMITDPRYSGSATANLEIQKAAQAITFHPIGDRSVEETVSLSATGGNSGEPVFFSVTSGPASIAGNQVSFSGVGLVKITATQLGNQNYEAAAPFIQSFDVKLSATVHLTRLHQVADGNAREIMVTTDPPGLETETTYNGSDEPPLLPGSYLVETSVTDPNYKGSASNTLVVDDPARLVTVSGGTMPAISALGALNEETFQIAAYETIQARWVTVVTWAKANAGYDFDDYVVGSTEADTPITGISWYEAAKWCNALTEWENTTFGRSVAPVYRIGTAVFRTGEPDPATVLVDAKTSGYRLPTAREWEFAARGGTLSTGKIYAGGNDPDLVAWHAGNSTGASVDLSGGRGIWPAGRKAANELGLYDFGGNVAEWTQEATPGNPSTRYLLGGSWNAAASESALGVLGSATPASRLNTSGLRVARSVATAITGALDDDELTWNSGGEAPWFAQTGTTHDNIDAAESGVLGQDDESWVETTVTGPGNLSFHWKSASVDGADILRFSIGASEKASLTGTNDWQERTFEISGGVSVLRWRFARTSPATAATSRVWLDEVVYTLATEPVLTTAPVTEVTETTATFGGEVTDDGGRAVTARGVVYGTTNAPTLDDSVAIAASGGTGLFSASGMNLAPGTTYHARAYATNAISTGYGPEVTFTTRASAAFNNGIANFTRSLLPGGRQVFKFNLSSPHIVSLSTLGGAALRAELYDSENHLITSFVGDADFDLEELLLAGDYELHVFREADGGAAQTFDLTIDASVVAVSRPDVAVGAAAGTLAGVSLYSPASQMAGLTSIKANAVTGRASFSNRGKLPDVLVGSATGGSALFAVSYSGPEGNITAGLLAGTYRTPEIDQDDAPVSIRATISPNKKKLTKKKGKRTIILKKAHVLSLRLTSTFYPVIEDAAKISVQTK